MTNKTNISIITSDFDVNAKSDLTITSKAFKIQNLKTVLITGGSGYVGSVLVPYLIGKGYTVKALDLHLYGRGTLQPHVDLSEIHGDIRDTELLKRELRGCNAVIHLACISNDPSFELDRELGRSINYDAMAPLVDIAQGEGIQRFIYASSSSVYGVNTETRVTEELSLEPLTDYSTYKAKCEDVLISKRAPGFETVILRPATISGYSPRFRMDVVVNTLTGQALQSRRIRVLGGQQQRANLHMADMCRAYELALALSSERVDGQVLNVGAENYKIIELAQRIRHQIGDDIRIDVEPSNDPRSYSLCSKAIARRWGFVPKYTLRQAITELQAAYRDGLIVDPINNETYYNVKMIKKAGLK